MESPKYKITRIGKKVYIKTTKRHIQFKSIEQLYERCLIVQDTIEWKKRVLPDLYNEQIKDGIIDAFSDFKQYYECINFIY
jgi:hypothetical protein